MVEKQCRFCGTVNRVRQVHAARGWGDYCNLDCKKGSARKAKKDAIITLPADVNGRLKTKPLRSEGYE